MPKPVVIYDGDCRFCVEQAARLERLVQGRVTLESFRDPGVLSKYETLTRPECEAAIHLVEPGGRVSRGAEAVARTLALRAVLAPVAILYRVPMLRALADWGYALVARNRFRLRGRVCTDESCHKHTR
ncbi:MAG: thiol-disulfide oxidoreductase DCC family protein [bacterium]